MRRLPLLALAATMSLTASCGGGDGGAGPRPAPVATVAPTPSPTITGTSFNVVPCLSQQVVPGLTGANLIIPDTMPLDVSKPNGFPNGRRLEDPVIDLVLAALFLDLTKHPVDLFARLPLNPPSNDVPLPSGFPYFAPAQGDVAFPPTNGVNFNFRQDPPSAYVRVDRTAVPGLATALIGGPMRNAFNDADPADDATGRFLSEMSTQLTALTNALADDFQRLNLSMCAKPVT
jgi:hypothetical protein